MAWLTILVIVGLVAGWSAGLETGPGLVFVYFVLVAVLGARDALIMRERGAASSFDRQMR
jgi:hypothetical protein